MTDQAHEASAPSPGLARPGRHDGGAATIPVPSPSSWRERQPYPIFRVEPTVVTGEAIIGGETAIVTAEQRAEIVRLFEPIKEQLFAGLEAGFAISFPESRSAPRAPIWWRAGRLLTDEEQEYMTVFNPIYVGHLTAGLAQALELEDIDEFKAALRRTTPEFWPPPARSQGQEMGIRKASSNFVNLIFVIDPGRRIDRLSADQKVALSRSFFAGLGSWKADIVSCTVEDGVARLNGVWMATLEGGHPFFQPDAIDELGWRHKAFGACTPVDVRKVPLTSGTSIGLADWEASATVEGIRASGRLLGRRGYLSESVRLGELVTSERMARMLEWAANYSQQGEGALFGWDPRLDALLVSATGQMGAMKANLKLNEVVAIAPLDAGEIGMIPVDGLGEPMKPSVEGPEFGFPLWSLVRQHPVYLRDTGSGFELCDAEGADHVVPPIRAGGHLHRGDVRSESSRVAHLDTDARRWPPVGCGVDASDEYSHHVFREAARLWEESGRTLEIVTYRVPGHSTNYLQFYAAGIVNAYDHSVPLAAVLESGELVFARDVPQVEQRIAPEPEG